MDILNQVFSDGRLNYIARMKKNLKGINITRKEDANGNEVVYVYAWKGGPRLYAPLESDEIIIEYADAIKRKKETPKNLAGLIDRYLASKYFNEKLKPKTIKTNSIRLRQLKETLGEMPLAVFDDPDTVDVLEDWRDGVAKRSPSTADGQWAQLSAALTWGQRRTFVKANPCIGGGKVYQGTRVDEIWSEDQIQTVIENAPWAFVVMVMLGLWTGQRAGSLLSLRWSAYDGHILSVVQEKNRKDKPAKVVHIVVKGEFKVFMDELERRAGVVGLSKAERDKKYIVLNGRGKKPWAHSSSFAGCFALVLESKTVNIKNRHFHDLRGTAVTRLARAGCTLPEIATITGHSLANVEYILDKHYLHRDTVLAEQAMDKRLAYEDFQLTSQNLLAAE